MRTTTGGGGGAPRRRGGVRTGVGFGLSAASLGVAQDLLKGGMLRRMSWER